MSLNVPDQEPEEERKSWNWRILSWRWNADKHKAEEVEPVEEEQENEENEEETD